MILFYARKLKIKIRMEKRNESESNAKSPEKIRFDIVD